MKILKTVKRPITTTLAAIVVIGVAYVIGAFLTGPGSVRAGGGVIPTAVLNMPCGILPATDTNGNAVTLLVRIAETTEARKAGLNGVGAKALDTMVLLYAHLKLESTRVKYETAGPFSRSPLSKKGRAVLQT